MSQNRKQAVYWAAVKSNFMMFVRHAFCNLNQGIQFMDNWHLHAIAYQLELAIKGERRRLIINLPPRHMKSFIMSVALPAFILGNDPKAKIICVSYSDVLAKDFSLQFRRLVASPWYQGLFPEVGVIRNAGAEFVTDQGGSRITTSVGGSITGRGGDFLIIDDPMKPDEVHSDPSRNRVNDWYRDVVQTRLDDPEFGVILIAMQRLHVNDLTGYVKDLERFTLLSLPVIAPVDRKVPIGPDKWHYLKEEDLLHPARMGQAYIDSLKKSLGPANFNAQYLQNPDTPEGDIFKAKWIKYVDQVPQDTDGTWIISIDTASTASETSDYTAITLLYSDRDGHYLVRSWRGRWEYSVLLSHLQKINRYYRHRFEYVIEAAGLGHALIPALRREGYFVVCHKPTVSKVARAHAVLPIVYAGRLHIVEDPDPQKNGWIKPVVDELVIFPRGHYDDQVDSLVQGMYWGERRENPHGSYLSGWLDSRFGSTP